MLRNKNTIESNLKRKVKSWEANFQNNSKKNRYKRRSDCNYALVNIEISKPFIERYPFNSMAKAP